MKDRNQAHPINHDLIYGKPKQWYLAAGLIGFLLVLLWVVAFIPAGHA